VEKVIIKRSIKSNLFLLFDCLGFVVLGLFMLKTAERSHVRFAAWLSIGFFGGGG